MSILDFYALLKIRRFSVIISSLQLVDLSCLLLCFFYLHLYLGIQRHSLLTSLIPRKRLWTLPTLRWKTDRFFVRFGDCSWRQLPSSRRFGEAQASNFLWVLCNIKEHLNYFLLEEEGWCYFSIYVFVFWLSMFLALLFSFNRAYEG